MKEKLILAGVVIALTFLIGYITVLTTTFVRDFVFGNDQNCQKLENSQRCSDTERNPTTLDAE